MTKKNFPAILITGATGNVGRELTKQLAARKVPFRAMIRSAQDAQIFSDLDGAATIVGNFDEEESLARALQGVERAFLLTNSSERAETQQSAFVEMARRSGVKHIVKL